MLKDGPSSTLSGSSRLWIEWRLRQQSGSSQLIPYRSERLLDYPGALTNNLAPFRHRRPLFLAVAIDMHSGIQPARIVERSSLMNATPCIREDGRPHSGLEFRSTG
jgi:hypothetical protein